MLNKQGIRELAYVVKVDEIKPIENYDRIVQAMIGGWSVVVGKDEFQVGDLGVFFEIDSKLPSVEPFNSMDFLVKKHYKIKTQKMCKGTVYSQGLLVPLSEFDNLGEVEEGTFLTEQLGVTYSSRLSGMRPQLIRDETGYDMRTINRVCKRMYVNGYKREKR